MNFLDLWKLVLQKAPDNWLSDAHLDLYIKLLKNVAPPKHVILETVFWRKLRVAEEATERLRKHFRKYITYLLEGQ